MALPVFAGSPIVSWGYGEAVAVVLGWTLLLLYFFLKLEKWSFAVFAAGVGLWFWMEWSSWEFGILYPVQAVWDVAAIFGAVWCLFGRTVAVSVDSTIKAIVKRSMAVAGVIAAVAGAVAYADSFRCESASGLKRAAVQDLGGTWWGSRTTAPKVSPVRLTLNMDGTGSLALGRRMATHPGGFRVRWLMRGRCFHFGATMTDYFAEGKACAQLSADGQTLTFTPTGPYGVSTYSRDLGSRLTDY